MTTINTAIPGLEKGKFIEPGEVRHRLNWSIYGETKTGKTSFPLSGEATGAIVIFDSDHRLEYVVQKHSATKPIMIHQINFPKVDPIARKKDDTVMREANKLWDDFLESYDLALKSSLMSGGVRRISIDTATELFDLRLMAEFGRLMGINPRDRGGANAEFAEIMRRPEKYDASVVWQHHVKEEWKNVVDENGREKSMTTGRWLPDGFKRANAITQVVAQTSYNDKTADPRLRFEVTVVRCGINSKLNGKKFTSLDWAIWDESNKDTPIVDYGPLSYISSLAVPETSPEDWD